MHVLCSNQSHNFHVPPQNQTLSLFFFEIFTQYTIPSFAISSVSHRSIRGYQYQHQSKDPPYRRFILKSNISRLRPAGLWTRSGSRSNKKNHPYFGSERPIPPPTSFLSPCCDVDLV